MKKRQKTNDGSVATIGDVKNIVGEAVDAVLNGMEQMFKDQKTFNLETYSTKTDLKKLENEIVWLRDDIKGIRSDLYDLPSRQEFNTLKTQVSNLTAN